MYLSITLSIYHLSPVKHGNYLCKAESTEDKDLIARKKQRNTRTCTDHCKSVFLET